MVKSKESIIIGSIELKSLGAKYREYTRKTIDERTGKFYTSNVLTLKSNPEFLSISNELYKTGKKEITLEYLKNFSELSLAVLFMDDGSKTNHSIRVYTNSFSTESLNNFIKFTKDRWDMSFNIDKLNQLYLPVKYYSLFKWLIKDYIHPSMEYKLH